MAIQENFVQINQKMVCDNLMPLDKVESIDGTFALVSALVESFCYIFVPHLRS